MNWLDQLQKFKDANPDLPEGHDADDCGTAPAQEMRQPRVDISVERKGRVGKTATLITGWILPDEKVREIAAILKQKLGTGGSARGGDILVQGDRRDDVLRELKDMGFKARII